MIGLVIVEGILKLSAGLQDAAAISVHAAQAIGHNPGWLLPSAYHLFGLQHPWSSDPDAFATTETGQLLINRSAHLCLWPGLATWIGSTRQLGSCGKSAVNGALSCL